MRTRNSSGNTALHIAVIQGKYAIVDQILRADPETMHIRKDDDEYNDATPFQRAVYYGHFEIVKHMMTIDPTVIDRPMWDNNMSMLHYATHPDVVQYLLECKPTLIDAVDEFGNTPLHHHARLYDRTETSNYSKTLRIILQRKPCLLYATNKKGNTAFQIATRESPLIVKFYLQCDPNLKYQGNDGNTLLHWIAACDEIVDPSLLVSVTRARQSELLVQNQEQLTPFGIALQQHNTRVSQQFLLYSALDNIISSYHMFSPSVDIDTWAVEQCSVLDTFLLRDLVFLVLEYLGAQRKHEYKYEKEH